MAKQPLKFNLPSAPAAKADIIDFAPPPARPRCGIRPHAIDLKELRGLTVLEIIRDAATGAANKPGTTKEGPPATSPQLQPYCVWLRPAGSSGSHGPASSEELIVVYAISETEGAKLAGLLMERAFELKMQIVKVVSAVELNMALTTLLSSHAVKGVRRHCRRGRR